MSKEKMLSKFPIEIIKSIIIYLRPNELLLSIAQLSKQFKQIAMDPMVMTVSFFSYLKIPFDYGGCEFAALRLNDRLNIMKRVLWKKSESEKISMVAYYTDGGVDGYTSTYFMQNLYVEKPSKLYSSKREDNINIKSIISKKIESKIDLQNIKQYLVPKEDNALYLYPEFTYIYPIESLICTYEPEFYKQFAVLKFYDINRNLTSYTCFLQSFALFVSMSEIDVNHPLVRLFDGIRTIDELDKLGFEYTMLQDTDDTKVVEFNSSSSSKLKESLNKNVPGAKLNGVYPVLWGDICFKTPNYLNLTRPIGYRYTLLKLIDSKKTQSDGNIDSYTMSVSGNLINLKHAYEE